VEELIANALRKLRRKAKKFREVTQPLQLTWARLYQPFPERRPKRLCDFGFDCKRDRGVAAPDQGEDIVLAFAAATW
jgi:hypothetical protein